MAQIPVEVHESYISFSKVLQLKVQELTFKSICNPCNAGCIITFSAATLQGTRKCTTASLAT